MTVNKLSARSMCLNSGIVINNSSACWKDVRGGRREREEERRMGGDGVWATGSTLAWAWTQNILQGGRVLLSVWPEVTGSTRVSQGCEGVSLCSLTLVGRWNKQIMLSFGTLKRRLRLPAAAAAWWFTVRYVYEGCLWFWMLSKFHVLPGMFLFSWLAIEPWYEI